MTMQSHESSGARSSGRFPYSPGRPIRNGNYHRVREGLLEIADKDGTFQSTEAVKALMKRLDLNYSSVSSAAFQWSDPTGVRGYRRVRLYSPRTSAADPSEMTEDRSAPPSKKKPMWVERAFNDAPVTNKNGPFYAAPGSGLFRGERRGQIFAELMKFQKEHGNVDGFWNLRSGVDHLADLGFNAGSVYRLIRQGLRADGIEKRGWLRRLKTGYAAEQTIDMEPEQVPSGVEPEVTPARVDPLSDPNSFKGPKTTEQVAEERGQTVEEFEKTIHDTALRQKVEALVQGTLRSPETIRAIDKLVGEAIIASAKRQLGLG